MNQMTKAEQALAEAQAKLDAIDAEIVEARGRRARAVALVEAYAAQPGADHYGYGTDRPFIGTSSRDHYGEKLGEDLRAANVELDELRFDRQKAWTARNAAERRLSELRAATRRASKLPAMATADREREEAKDRAARAERERADALAAEIARAGGSVRSRLSAALGGSR